MLLFCIKYILTEYMILQVEAAMYLSHLYSTHTEHIQMVTPKNAPIVNGSDNGIGCIN